MGIQSQKGHGWDVGTVVAMDLDDYGHFPLRSFLGMQVESFAEGNGVARLEVSESLLNPNGVVHGGVLFTMVDTAMGKATMTTLGEGQLCASIEIHLRFLRPVAKGRLEATAAVVRRGRRIIHLECRVEHPGDSIVATATGTFSVISSRPT